MGKLFLLVVSAATMCLAAPGNAATTNEPIQGLRIFTCAHSFHGFMPANLSDIAKSEGIEDQEQVGKSGINLDGASAGSPTGSAR
ncbi:MAG: hypothetical protein K9M54_05995 [Kiritimatiellales bacterium]|nr:hypothetical protein [Kiritimatiellales bacterium]MCF7864246.1 hypothetical protein [Kiritimatiellales bacterium]